MKERTCAACDCALDANAIKGLIGGKTVEVCCDECAQKLREAIAGFDAVGLSDDDQPCISEYPNHSDTVGAHCIHRAGHRAGCAVRARRAVE